MQPWLPAFNPSKLEGMRMPVWVMFKNEPEEFLSSVQDMADKLTVVLGRHKGNAQSLDQKFCVGIKTREPFDLSLKAINLVSGESSIIQVDYNNLPIRCRYCLATFHLVKDYLAILASNETEEQTARDDSKRRNPEDYPSTKAKKTINREKVILLSKDTKGEHEYDGQTNGKYLSGTVDGNATPMPEASDS